MNYSYQAQIPNLTQFACINLVQLYWPAIRRIKRYHLFAIANTKCWCRSFLIIEHDFKVNETQFIISQYFLNTHFKILHICWKGSERKRSYLKRSDNFIAIIMNFCQNKLSPLKNIGIYQITDTCTLIQDSLTGLYADAFTGVR